MTETDDLWGGIFWLREGDRMVAAKLGQCAEEIARLRTLLRDLHDFSMMDPRLYSHDELIRREQELGERIAEALK